MDTIAQTKRSCGVCVEWHCSRTTCTCCLFMLQVGLTGEGSTTTPELSFEGVLIYIIVSLENNRSAFLLGWDKEIE